MVYGTKQFRHYLLGHRFRIITDHKPLCWLSAQKMEGRLCRWALALQEFDYIVEYRKGSENIMLSRKPLEKVNLVCEFSPNIDRNQIRDCQNRDPLLRRIISLVSKEENPNNSTESLPRRYHQMWDQLKIVDGLLCREYDIEGFGNWAMNLCCMKNN